MSRDLGRDVPDVEKLYAKNFGLIFRSLVTSDTPPISITILLRKYAILLAESSIYATNLYHDTPPICIQGELKGTN